MDMGIGVLQAAAWIVLLKGLSHRRFHGLMYHPFVHANYIKVLKRPHCQSIERGQ